MRPCSWPTGLAAGSSASTSPPPGWISTPPSGVRANRRVGRASRDSRRASSTPRRTRWPSRRGLGERRLKSKGGSVMGSKCKAALTVAVVCLLSVLVPATASAHKRHHHKGGHVSGGQGSVTKSPFGTLPDGRAVDLYTLTNGGVTVKAMTYGATVTEIDTPDRHGNAEN